MHDTRKPLCNEIAAVSLFLNTILCDNKYTILVFEHEPLQFSCQVISGPIEVLVLSLKSIPSRSKFNDHGIIWMKAVKALGA